MLIFISLRTVRIDTAHCLHCWLEKGMFLSSLSPLPYNAAKHLNYTQVCPITKHFFREKEQGIAGNPIFYSLPRLANAEMACYDKKV